MAKKRYVLVGTGVRALNFISPIAQRYRDEAELVALCDLSPTRMAYHNAKLAGEYGYHAVATYPADQFEKMIREQKPNTVIVTSKDSTHHDYIVRAVQLGCDVITEKPMTIDTEKTRAIMDAVAKTSRKVQVAFNYRWSAHRTKVWELIRSGVVGEVKNVNVEYVLNTNHGADYYRRWHATMADSGGLLVHKSTHHFDLVNWWIDAIPDQVFAYGRLDFYGRKNAIARGETERTTYSRYTDQAAAKSDPFALDLREHASLTGLYFDAEKDTGYLRDQNVFRNEIDIYDNMSVVVRYRTGVQLNYSLVSFSSREGMRVSLTGDKGRIEYSEWQATHAPNLEPAKREEADKASESIRVYPLFQPSYDVHVQKLQGTHDGADPVLAEQMYAAKPAADPFQRKAGHEQGAASILIGIAANQSIATNRPVNVADLVNLKPGARHLHELV